MPVNIGQNCADKRLPTLLWVETPGPILAKSSPSPEDFNNCYIQCPSASMAVNLTRLLLCEIPIVYGTSGRIGLLGRWCDGNIMRATGRGRGTYR